MSTYSKNVPSANGTLTKGELFVTLSTLDPNNKVVKKTPAGFVGIRNINQNGAMLFDLNTNTEMLEAEARMLFGWTKRLVKEDKLPEAKLLIQKSKNPSEVLKFVMKNLNSESVRNLEERNVELKEQYREFGLTKISDEIDKNYLTNTAGKTLLYMVTGENIADLDLNKLSKKDLGNKLINFARENYSEFSHVMQVYAGEIEKLTTSTNVLEEKRAILNLEGCIKSLCNNSTELDNKVTRNLDKSYEMAVDNKKFIIENADKYAEVVSVYGNATTHFNNRGADHSLDPKTRSIN